MPAETVGRWRDQLLQARRQQERLMPTPEGVLLEPAVAPAPSRRPPRAPCCACCLPEDSAL